MTEAIKLSRTDAFEHTINGLLEKRADLFNEAIRIRDRLAEIKNDIGALDRVLGTLGYTGDLDELRDATEPLSSREIARAVVAVGGQDARDRKLIMDVTRRASKALRILKQGGSVRSAVDAKGNLMWSIVARRERE